MKRTYVVVRSRQLLGILAKRNMCQNGLARATHLTSGHISQLISRKRNPSPQVRQRIMNFLGVDFHEIFALRYSL